MTGCVVVVPARDEAAHLPALLGALAAQQTARPFAILLGLNNTTDGSASLAAGIAARLAAAGPHPRLHIRRTTLPPGRAHAGGARRWAMARAAALLDDDRGVLISTDADTLPPPHWVQANIDALSGAELAGGRLVIADAPALLGPRLAALDAYWAQVRAIEDAVDPLPWDPPPRHGDHTGASLALRRATLCATGGVPALPVGEDRALVAAAQDRGARLVHPPAIHTRVSARLAGRCDGGMATGLATIADQVRAGAPTMLPGFACWQARAAWRRAHRAAATPRLAALEAALPPMPHDHPVA